MTVYQRGPSESRMRRLSWYLMESNASFRPTVSTVLYNVVLGMKLTTGVRLNTIPDSKVHGANMGPIWDRQDPGGPHVGPMSFAIWDHAKKDYQHVFRVEYEHFYSQAGREVRHSSSVREVVQSHELLYATQYLLIWKGGAKIPDLANISSCAICLPKKIK